jgi:hypothetical protein
MEATVEKFGPGNHVKFKGMETFNGDMYHTARWNHDVKDAGKRMAVIGNGYSAAQVIPRFPNPQNLSSNMPAADSGTMIDLTGSILHSTNWHSNMFLSG